MAYKINADECVGCAACVATCPAEAIKELDGVCEIEAAKCTDCGACADSCPTEAIAPA